MTGFGAAEGAVGGRRARIEIRTVNHRWFHFSARLPTDLAPLEGELREAMRRAFDRGHVTVSVRWVEDPSTATVAIDWARAEAAVGALREVRDRFHLAGEVSLEVAARYLDLSVTRGEVMPVTWDDLKAPLEEAVTDCRAARQREGGALTGELQGRLADLERSADRVAEAAPVRLQKELARLRDNVKALLDGKGPDEARVAQEVAILADRLDITEELVRFRVHLAAASRALESGGPVGKQLGFLTQELGREANTMGSKANDAGIAHEVVEMKSTLEKFREQVENLE